MKNKGSAWKYHENRCHYIDVCIVFTHIFTVHFDTALSEINAYIDILLFLKNKFYYTVCELKKIAFPKMCSWKMLLPEKMTNHKGSIH